MSALMPWTLSAGIRLTVPTASVPSPVAEISSRPFSEPLAAVNCSRVLANSLPDVCNRHRLPVAGRLAPDEADLDRAGLAPRQPDASHVGLARHQGQSGLHDAAGLVAGQRDPRAVFAYEGRFPDHRHRLRGADGLPGRLALADRVEELAIFEHFGPDAAVDAAAEVLDELAVNVLGDRRADLGGIDADRDLRRGLGRHGIFGRQLGKRKRRCEQRTGEKQAEKTACHGEKSSGLRVSKLPSPACRAQQDGRGAGGEAASLWPLAGEGQGVRAPLLYHNRPSSANPHMATSAEKALVAPPAPAERSRPSAG